MRIAAIIPHAITGRMRAYRSTKLNLNMPFGHHRLIFGLLDPHAVKVC